MGYNAIHNRIYRLWGSARRYDCVKCRGQAQEWAYDGTDPSAKLDKRKGSLFSEFPEFYKPLCRICHRGQDNFAAGKIRGSCTIEGCSLPHKARGMCAIHYRKFKYWTWEKGQEP